MRSLFQGADQAGELYALTSAHKFARRRLRSPCTLLRLEGVTPGMQRCTHVPQAFDGRMYRPRRPRASALYQCATRHAPELKAGGRFGRRVEESVIEALLSHPGSFRTPGALRRLVLEPQQRKAPALGY